MNMIGQNTGYVTNALEKSGMRGKKSILLRSNIILTIGIIFNMFAWALTLYGINTGIGSELNPFSNYLFSLGDIGFYINVLVYLFIFFIKMYIDSILIRIHKLNFTLCLSLIIFFIFFVDFVNDFIVIYNLNIWFIVDIVAFILGFYIGRLVFGGMVKNE